MNFDFLFPRDGSVGARTCSRKSRDWVSKKFLFCYCLLDRQVIWSTNNDIRGSGCFNLRCRFTLVSDLFVTFSLWVFNFWTFRHKCVDLFLGLHQLLKTWYLLLVELMIIKRKGFNDSLLFLCILKSDD